MIHQSWNSDHSIPTYRPVERNGFSQITDMLTRVTDISDSLLKLVLSDSPHFVKESMLLLLISTSDSSVLQTSLTLNTSKSVMVQGD